MREVAAVFQVWDDNTGERVEVGEDRDGLELVEVRNVFADGKFASGVTFKRQQLMAVIDALHKYQAYLSSELLP